MICFKDMTFCSAKCANIECPRNWEKRDRSDYEEWSKGFKNGGPIAFSNFSETCDEYKEVKV